VTPYYEQDGVTIYHGDCREWPSTSPVFDLMLTDPPYGLGAATWDQSPKTPARRWRLHHGQMEWDNALCDVRPLLACARLSVIWGGHLMQLPAARGWLVWNKIIRHFSSGVCELAWTNLDIPIDAFDYSHGQLANEGKMHPTQKPLGLMRWCIDKAGDVHSVFDPFMGSGTTLVAAKQLGRRAVGIELNERYCEIAANRLRQGSLFVAGDDAPAVLPSSGGLFPETELPPDGQTL
jgi:DNA modification methylase